MAYALPPKDERRVVVWEWKEDSGIFLPYSPEESNFLEAARTKNLTMVELRDVSREFSFFRQVDLTTMCQISKTTGRRREIRRKKYDLDSPPGQGVQWEWWSDYYWAPYDLPTACCIDESYTSRKTSLDLSTTRIGIYNIVNFADMTQVNKYTNFRREVRRRILSTKYVNVKSVRKTSHGAQSALSTPSSPPKRKIRSMSQEGNEHSKTKKEADTDDPVEKYGLDTSNPPDEDCCICLEKLSISSSPDGGKDSDEVKELKQCHHFFHTNCLRDLYNSGSKDGSLQCPTCKCIHGTKHGNQPNTGTMTVRTSYQSLPGYEGHSTINIIYNFTGGTQDKTHPHPGMPFTARGFPRSCYLPDDSKGRKVLELLKVAWERKLIFTISTSTTTGETDTVVWNEIHHKTSINNYNGHGYPDPSYLDNVIQELAAHGVTEEDLS